MLSLYVYHLKSLFLLLLVMSKFLISIHVLCAMHCVSLFYQNIITLVEFVFNPLLSAVCFFVTFRVRFACFLSLNVNKRNRTKMRTPGNSSWTSDVSHFHKRPYLSSLATSVPSLPMTQVYILLARRLRQAVPLSALTLMQQELGRTGGVTGIRLESGAQRGDRKIQGRQKMCRNRGSNSGLRN